MPQQPPLSHHHLNCNLNSESFCSDCVPHIRELQPLLGKPEKFPCYPRQGWESLLRIRNSLGSTTIMIFGKQNSLLFHWSTAWGLFFSPPASRAVSVLVSFTHHMFSSEEPRSSAASDLSGKVRVGLQLAQIWQRQLSLLLCAGSGLPTAVYDTQRNKADPNILALLWLAQVCSWYHPDLCTMDLLLPAP